MVGRSLETAKKKQTTCSSNNWIMAKVNHFWATLLIVPIVAVDFQALIQAMS